MKPWALSGTYVLTTKILLLRLWKCFQRKGSQQQGSRHFLCLPVKKHQYALARSWKHILFFYLPLTHCPFTDTACFDWLLFQWFCCWLCQKRDRGTSWVACIQEKTEKVKSCYACPFFHLNMIVVSKHNLFREGGSFPSFFLFFPLMLLGSEKSQNWGHL